MVQVTLKSKTAFLKIMGANPRNRILDFLIENKRESWTMIEIRDNANVGYATLKLILPEMEKEGLIKVTKIVGRSKLYTINNDSSIVEKIESLHQEIINST